jgi:hypothetical protein
MPRLFPEVDLRSQRGGLAVANRRIRAALVATTFAAGSAGLLAASPVNAHISGVSVANAEARDVPPPPRSDSGSASTQRLPAAPGRSAGVNCILVVQLEGGGDQWRSGAASGCDNQTPAIQVITRLQSCVSTETSECRFAIVDEERWEYQGGGSRNTVHVSEKWCYGGGEWNGGLGIYACDTAAPVDSRPPATQPCNASWWADATTRGYNTLNPDGSVEDLKYEGSHASGHYSAAWC